MNRLDADTVEVGEYIQHSLTYSKPAPPIWRVVRIVTPWMRPTELDLVKVAGGKFRPGWDNKTITRAQLVNYRKVPASEVEACLTNPLKFQ